MTATDDRAARLASARRWLERHPPAGNTDVDALLVRQLAGYARRLTDALGHQLEPADVLAALNDTGLCLIHDADGYAADAHRWAVFVIAADDPLDAEPTVDSHFDREREGREEAAQRPNIRRFEEGA